MIKKFSVLLLILSVVCCLKNDRCLKMPNSLKKVEASIKYCEDQVKDNFVGEAFRIIQSHWNFHEPESDIEYSIQRRTDDMDIHYNYISLSDSDKRVAGCLLHCIYGKNKALDENGWPTLDGLLEFFSEGVDEYGFFLNTLRAVDFCLKGSSIRYHINRHNEPKDGQSCDISFEVFDCVSDRITEYCAGKSMETTNMTSTDTMTTSHQ